jgi:hypothetical protein
MGEFDRALAALEKARAIGVALADTDTELAVICSMMFKHMWRGEYELARAHITKWRELATVGTSDALTQTSLDEASIQWFEAGMLGNLALAEGDYAQAEHWLTLDLQWIAEHGGSGNKIATSARVRRLGYALLYQGDFTRAVAYLRESLIDNASLSDTQAVAACLAAFAALALAGEAYERAARLFGASEALCDSIHMRLQHWDVVHVRRNAAALREQLDKPAHDAAWDEGRAMSYDQAIEYALQEDDTVPSDGYWLRSAR